MKKMLAALMACVLLLAAIPAMADNVRTSGDFKYTIKGNGTATIVGYTGKGDMIIPQMLDGYTVTAIGDNAFYQDSLNSSKTSISVTIPETVKSIGEFAFWNMDVHSINLPDALEYIGRGAFVGCNSITYRISSNHPAFAVIDGALYNKSEKELIMGKVNTVIPEGIRSIRDYSCYGVDNCGITSEGIVLPSTIEKIGDYAFYGNYYQFKITENTAENGFIKDNGEHNWSPYELIWGKNLQTIGDYAFSNVRIDWSGKHPDVNYYEFVMPIPDSVKEIGEGCFSNFGYPEYDDLTLYIGENSQLREIPTKAFYHDEEARWTECIVECHAPITSVGDYAFFDTHITGLDLQSIKELGKGAFVQANFSYSTLLISCKIIPEDAFRNSDGEPYISDGVEVIEANAFSDCFFRDSIYLPSSLTSIDQNAFDKDEEFVVEKGSYAYRWADENAYNYTINGEEQNLDWLNN